MKLFAKGRVKGWKGGGCALKKRQWLAAGLALFAYLVFAPGDGAHPVKATNIDALIEKLDQLDDADYGGYYLTDEEAILHINQRKELPLGIAQTETVKIHDAANSLEELRNLQASLEKKMRQLNIATMYINFPENKLEIHVYQPEGKKAALKLENADDAMYTVVYDQMPFALAMECA